VDADFVRAAVLGKLAGRRAVKRAFSFIRFVWWRMAQRIGQDSNPAMQFIVNPAKQPSTLKLICGKTKSRQHNHKDEAIPELQPPLDGLENFHSMQ